MTFFKFLAKGAVSPVTGRVWTPGEWVEVAGPIAPCERGVHVLRPLDLAHWLHDELWTIEVDGPLIQGPDSLVASRARLGSEVVAWRDSLGRGLGMACQERLIAAVARVSDGPLRSTMTQFVESVARHVARPSPPMAAYAAALGHSREPDDTTVGARFRRARAWQSRWLVDNLLPPSGT